MLTGKFWDIWKVFATSSLLAEEFPDTLQSVPSGYPNPTRYPVFLSIPDPTRFSFRNHRVAGNPKHRVLPDISGKPEVSGTTRYSGYHP